MVRGISEAVAVPFEHGSIVLGGREFGVPGRHALARGGGYLQCVQLDLDRESCGVPLARLDRESCGVPLAHRVLAEFPERLREYFPGRDIAAPEAEPSPAPGWPVINCRCDE